MVKATIDGLRLQGSPAHPGQVRGGIHNVTKATLAVPLLRIELAEFVDVAAKGFPGKLELDFPLRVALSAGKGLNLPELPFQPLPEHLSGVGRSGVKGFLWPGQLRDHSDSLPPGRPFGVWP